MSWRGLYFDGRSAARREAEIVIVPAALHIRPEGGGTVVWPFDRLRWIDPPENTGSARLALDGGAARLEIEDSGFVAELRAAWPEIDRAAARGEKRGRSAVIIAAAIAALAALVWAAAAVLPAVLAPLVPDPVRRSMGDAMVDQIVELFGTVEGRPGGLCERPAGRAALDRLLDRLSPNGGYAVTVADIGMINALAAPGGRIVLFRGLIEFAATPEELAGVLAHEIGHAVHEHPTRAVIREIGLSATLDLVAGGGGLAGRGAGLLARTAWSREAEREADDTAVVLLREAGIGTDGMITLFERLAAREGSATGRVQLLSTHPRSADRADRIRATGHPGAGPAMSDADWQAVRSICDAR